MFVDLTDSVRLMQADMDGTVRRWNAVLHEVVTRVLPQNGGQLVKRSGDGFMLQFVEARAAVVAAFAIQSVFARANVDAPHERAMLPRIGVHTGRVFSVPGDLLGDAVNIAARLEQNVASPGEIVVSAAVRDQLTDTLDADIEDLGHPDERKSGHAAEDLGECILKNVDRPIRAYRLGAPASKTLIAQGSASARLSLHPAIAVIPFACRPPDAAHEVVGQMLADDLIAALSCVPHLRVISGLSTAAFRHRDFTLSDVSKHLNTRYVLSGTYRVSGRRLNVMAQLADSSSEQIIWCPPAALRGDIDEIVAGESAVIPELLNSVSREILKHQVECAQTKPLPNLHSYTLLLGAVVLMHRGSATDFERAGEMLELLRQRVRRSPLPHAWMAKWHVLRFNRGRSGNLQTEAREALECTKHALEVDDKCSLALTIDGFVHTNLLKRLDIGRERYDAALAANPNESLALLLRGTLHAFRGEGECAVRDTEKALSLSPLDPLRYFYESLAATAADSAGDYERAIELATRSLRANRFHPSTLRALAIALAQLGRLDDAREAIRELLKLEPKLTVRAYLDQNPSGAFPTGKIWAQALRRAGLPA
jgi:class 3 adenylate cyclase/TolB-like protein